MSSDLDKLFKDLKIYIIIFSIPSETTIESPRTFLEEIDTTIYLLAYMMIGSPINPRNLVLDRTFIPISPIQNLKWDMAHVTITEIPVSSGNGSLSIDDIEKILKSQHTQVFIEQNTQTFYTPSELYITLDDTIEIIKIPNLSLKRAVFNDLDEKNWLILPQPSSSIINITIMPGLMEGPAPEINSKLIEKSDPYKYYIGLD